MLVVFYRISMRGKTYFFLEVRLLQWSFFSSAHPVGVETFSVLVIVCPGQMTEARNFLAIFMEYRFSSHDRKSGRLP